MTTLQKIKNLQYFDGLKNLKIVLEEFFSSITALETNSVIVGYSNRQVSTAQSGLLVVGREYVIAQQEGGDNFSNVGYVADGIPFIATGTTPTSWANDTQVKYYTWDIVIIYNDVDSNLQVTTEAEAGDYTDTKFLITNGKFLQNKTYPNYETALATIVDSNTITFDKVKGYFKIEVYN